MQVSDKLEEFTKTVLLDAQRQRQEKVDEINTEYERRLEETHRHVEHECDERVNEHEQALRQEANKKIMSATVQARHALIEQRQKLLAELWQNVTAQVAAFIATPEYIEQLKEDILACATVYPQLEICLTARDLPIISTRITDGKIKFTEGSEEMLGGFIATADNGRIVIDSSFKTRLESVRQSFNGLSISD